MDSSSSLIRKRRKRCSQSSIGSHTFRFFQSWKDEFTWLRYSDCEDLIFCHFCKQESRCINPNSGYIVGTKATRSNSLEKHSLSNPHIKAESAVKAAENPDKTPMSLALRKLKGETLEKMRYLFHTAYFVAYEDLAFTKFDKLCNLQSPNGVKIETLYTNDTRAREFVGFIAEALRQGQSDPLHQVKYISVMSDSSTDRSLNEQEIIYIRNINHCAIPQSLYVGLGAIRRADGKGILEVIDQVLLKRGWIDWKDKLVGFGADRASVMMGCKNGVAALLKADIPHLVEIHCVAHRLQLSVLDAIRDHSYIIEFEGGLKKLFSFYNKSPKRLRELEEVANFLDGTVRKFGSIYEVRWMASKQGALNVTINNWRSVIFHLEDASARGTRDESATAKGILKVITSYKWVSYLHFLTDLMGVLTKWSLQLQSDDLTGTKLSIAIDTAKMELHNFSRRPGKFFLEFLEKCTDGEWLGIKLNNPQLTHEDAFSSILESVIYYI